MLADDLDELKKVLFGQLARFLDSKSIDRMLNPFTASSSYAHKLKELNFRVPSNIRAIRESWNSNQNMPIQDGIILSDGSVVTASITVREISKNWQAGNLSSLKPIISLLNRTGEPWAYVSSYSYSFYPNSSSPQARLLGYFRYDFHPETLGDGDLGGHPYFHLHREFVGGEQEGEEELRFTTGLVHLSEILAICEHRLFPDQRQQRLKNYFTSGKFEELAMDLSATGFDRLISQQFSSSSKWMKFKYRNECEKFAKRKGWKLTKLQEYDLKNAR